MRAWLGALLPPDAAERCNRGGLRVVATALPSLRVLTFSDFSSKEDLVQVSAGRLLAGLDSTTRHPTHTA